MIKYFYKMRTTDLQEEVFVIVDKKDQIISQATRKQVHQNKSLIHRSISVLVFNKRKQLFLQKRSSTKDTYPSFWTSSCSGHVNWGESYRQAAKREIQEELSIKIKKPLSFLFKRLIFYPHETEYMGVYRYTTDGPINIAEREIKEGRFFSPSDFSQKVKKMKITPDLAFIIKHYLNKKWKE